MEDILATLTYDAALPLVGHRYRVDAGAQSTQLVMTRVVRAAERGPRPKELKRDSFSIFFEGPVPLPQQMYDLVGDSETFPNLFIVPVGRSANAYEYEAVFT